MLTKLGSQFGKGGTGLSDGTLAVAVAELQNFKEVVVAGAAANTNIAIAGIKTTDTLQSVLKFDAGVPSSVTGIASITSAGNIQLTADSAGKTLVVRYWQKP